MKNKKGFTLIELLSVIIILGIILVIAVPQVLNVITSSREQSLESSAKLIARTIEQEYEIRNMGIGEGEMPVSCEDFGWETSNGECNFSVSEEGIVTVEITGTGKFSGLKAEGTKNSITITETVEGSSFACGEVFVDDRDQANVKEYATVEIGDQCWFAEDLMYDCGTTDWNGNGCRLNGNAAGTVADALSPSMHYQWLAAMAGYTVEDGDTTTSVQGICPEGWLLPSHDDYTDLERYVCNESGNTDCNTKFPKDTSTSGWRGTNEGQQLKSTNPSWSGTNTVRFNAKPAGYRITSGDLRNVGSYGFWWSSSPSGSRAWRRNLYSSNSDVYRITDLQAYGFSVRCFWGQ